MKVRSLVVLVFLLLIPSIAFSGNYYINLSASYLLDNEDETVKSSTGGEIIHGYEGGYLASVSLGRKFDNYLALELEAFYGRTDLESADNGGSIQAVDGHLGFFGFMLNPAYNYPITEWLDLHLLAGLGMGRYSSNDYRLSNGASGNDDNDWAFTYQAGAGFKFHLTDFLALTTAYRYIGSTDFTHELGDDVSFRQDLSVHSFRGGIEFSF